ncbi:MAG: putative drug exporter of the superfamily [Actinomycetota bacterium]|nr:putative drug exporter of the superfamily [Actinomycetota bacterium]
MFGRLGGWCHDHRRIVLAGWVLALFLAGGILGSVGSAYRADFNLPNVESRQGFEVLEEHFGGQGTGESGTVVFRSDKGVNDPSVRGVMEPYLAKVAEVDRVARVVSPYSEEGSNQISDTEGHQGDIGYATVELDPEVTFENAIQISNDIREAMPEQAGLQIELGGAIFGEFEPPSSELLGVAFAMVILVLAFGSVLAMGLPISVALAGIGIGTITVGLLSNLITIPDFATQLGLMIGLGVGIDYALFIVTRFREQLHAGDDIGPAVRKAIDTAGRAVAFAGITVVISLLGMLVMQISFVSGLAIGAAVVVLMTMVAALTLLPALLGFAGNRVELTRWRGLIGAAFLAIGLLGVGLKVPVLFAVCLPLAAVVMLASLAVRPLRQPVPRPAPKPRSQTLAYRWSRLIQHHPWPSAIGAVLLLILLALPVFGLRLGFSDEGNYAEDTTTRKAYDLLADGFGPGFNGTMLVVSVVPPGTPDAALQRVTDALKSAPGVAFASDVSLNDEANPTAALWRVVPTTSPQDAATTTLVSNLRDDILPPATEGTGLDVSVTGTVAILVDFSDYMTARMPIFFGAVLGLSFLLLMTVFRSVLVPLKAVIMNLLSLGAAFGVVVAIFQWGWGASLLNLDKAPIEPFVPMMLFAIVFGLSMDYEVFLLSRIREAWKKSGDSRESVADGLAATARVITAAALIMVFVFGSFLLENDRVIKLFGIGLAGAVLLDATIVRMLLVPATMELLGDKNWWLPRWLDKLLPDVAIEGEAISALDDVRVPSATGR